MDDLDVLVRDLGFGGRGKSNPMRSDPQSDRRSTEEPLFDDVFGGPPKYSPNSNANSSNKQSPMSEFDYDSIFKSSENNHNDSSSHSSNRKGPVFDKPVYDDDDIFDGLPGLKNQSGGSSAGFDNNVFASISSPPQSSSRNQKSDIDDFLGNLGRNEKAGESYKSSSVRSSSNAKGFDDLLPGFGTSSSSVSSRPTPVSGWGSIPTAPSKHGNVLDDPFVVLESSATQGSSSPEVFMDPLDDMNKLGKSRSERVDASSGRSAAFDDLDPLSQFGKAGRSSPGREDRGKNGGPSRATSSKSDASREQKGNSSFRYSESNTVKKIPVDNFQEPPIFDMPNASTDFHNSFAQPISPQYYETPSYVGMSPTSDSQGQQFDDIWLTVSQIHLFTQPTPAPPPSRSPPPIPRQSSRSEIFFSSSKKKNEEKISTTMFGQHMQSPRVAHAAAKGPPVSQFDELDDFAMGKAQNSFDGGDDFHYSEEANAFSAAAASAAAMKDAMDKAEAKFKHAKEVRERENAKAARNKGPVQLEKDEHEAEDLEFRENQERLEREHKQKEEEEKERERIRLEKERERSRELERERARQAVERATREARERAAADARERASTEARLRAERAAVDKANAEARGRAERVAVQRVQAEARERAATEAKERAERVAAEARERAAAESRERAAAAREKDLREKAEAETRRRSERAAVERAASEARERATAEARERAAASAKVNQQQNDDLESFFSMGRASSAPRDRTNSTDHLFNQQYQNKGGFDAPKWTSASTQPASSMKKASSATNIVDDLSSIFGGAPSAGDFQDVEGETEERRRARLDRHQRTQERAAKALAEKNQRDLQVLRDQEERHRISESLDYEIKRWAAGKEGNLRALLSTLQYVLWPECGWQPVSLTDLITGASVKKVYRKATLCIHPDKVQQKGATLQQKYIAEKVFDLLKESWNKFNSEELF